MTETRTTKMIYLARTKISFGDPCSQIHRSPRYVHKLRSSQLGLAQTTMAAGQEESQFPERKHYHRFLKGNSQLKSSHPISDHAHSIPMTHVNCHWDLLPTTFCHLKLSSGVRMSADSHLVAYLRDPTCLHRPYLSARLLGLMRAGHLDLIMMNSGYRGDRLVNWSMFERAQVYPHHHFL